MNGWEIEDASALFASDETERVAEFSRAFQMAAVNPEVTALVIVRKYDPVVDGPPGPDSGRDYRVGIAVATAAGSHVFQLPTLRTYLSLSIVGSPGAGDEKIVIETDLGVAVTTLREMTERLPTMADGQLKEPRLEDAFESLSV